MANFEILKREIAECRIRAKSKETIEVLNYLQDFAENNLNNGWISVNDDLPKISGRYLCYRLSDKKQVVEPLLDDMANDKAYLKALGVTHWQYLPKLPKL